METKSLAAERIEVDTRYGAIGVGSYSIQDLTSVDVSVSRIASSHVTPSSRAIETAGAHDRFPRGGYLESRGINANVIPLQASLGLMLMRCSWTLGPCRSRPLPLAARGG